MNPHSFDDAHSRDEAQDIVLRTQLVFGIQELHRYLSENSTGDPIAGIRGWASFYGADLMRRTIDAEPEKPAEEDRSEADGFVSPETEDEAPFDVSESEFDTAYEGEAFQRPEQEDDGAENENSREIVPAGAIDGAARHALRLLAKGILEIACGGDRMAIVQRVWSEVIHIVPLEFHASANVIHDGDGHLAFKERLLGRLSAAVSIEQVEAVFKELGI